ncbi:MAG TPA: TetR/AcrR family transcriptional regulator [Gemmatimonadales bacterium]|nr:TetR/AcrR family transcriptional regulator [Gemmatimonadales bacterium]
MAKPGVNRKRAPRRAAEPRRRPQQERGEKRVEEILDAAESVIADLGVAATTTNAIADRAGASVGSLYHFFPNKDAIIRALAARYEGEMRQIKDTSLALEVAAAVPIRDMVNGIVDPFVAFMQRHPAYLEVFHATGDPRRPSCLSEELHQTIVGQVEALMAARAPATAPAYRRLQARFAVEYVHRMLEAAWDQPPALRQGMVDELKRLFILHSEMVTSGRDPLA